MHKTTLFIWLLCLFCMQIPAQNRLIDSLQKSFDKVELNDNKTTAFIESKPKIALFNTKGKQITDYEFDEIQSIWNTFFFVKKKNKYALMDAEGHFLSDFKWEFVQSFSKENALVKSNGLFGLLQKNGQITLPCEYNNISFSSGVNGFICQKEGKYGFLSRDAKWILPVAYDLIVNSASVMGKQLQGNEFAYLLVTNKGRTGLYNANGKEIIPIKFESIQQQNEKGLVRVSLNLNGSKFQAGFYDKLKIGYYDLEGNCIIPPIFHYSNSYDNDGFFQGIADDTFYLYNQKKLIFKLNKYAYTRFLNVGDGFFKIGVRDSIEFEKAPNYLTNNTPNGINVNSCDIYPPKKLKLGLMNKQEQVLISPLYNQIEFLGTHLIGVRKDEKWAIFSDKGKQLSDFIYENIWGGANGYLVLVQNKKMGLVDSFGKVIIPFEYKKMEYYQKNKWIIQTESGKYGVVNLQNKLILPVIYDEIAPRKYDKYETPSPENNLFISQNNQKGLMDSALKVIIPCEYKNLVERDEFYEGEKEDKNEQYSYFNRRGKKIKAFSEAEYRHLKNEGYALFFYQNGKLGVIDTSGKEVVPFLYDDYRPLYDLFYDTTLRRTFSKREYTFLLNNTEKVLYNGEFQIIADEDSLLRRSKIAEMNVEEQKRREAKPIPNFPIPYQDVTYLGDKEVILWVVKRPEQKGIVYFSSPPRIEFYDEIQQNSNYNFVIMKKKGEEALLSRNFETLIPLQNTFRFLSDNYYSNRYLYSSPNLLSLENKKTGRFGLYDVSKKKIILSPIYSFIYAVGERKNHFFVVKKSKKYALANENERFIIPFECDSITSTYDNKFVIYKGKDKKHFQIIDTTGKLVLPDMFEEMEYKSNFIQLKKEGKMYYYTYTWKSIPSKYSLVGGNKIDAKNYFVATNAEKDTLYGLIDDKGRVIIPQEYDNIFQRNIMGDELVQVQKGEKWGIYHLKLGLIAPIQYDNIRLFYQKFLLAQSNQGFDVYTLSGKKVTPMPCQEVGASPKEAIKAKQNEKWGIIDTTGRTLIPFEYEAISEMFDNHVIAQKNAKCGFLSSENIWLIPPIYEGMEMLDNGFLKIKKDCKYLLANKQGKELTMANYDNITPLYAHGIYVGQETLKDSNFIASKNVFFSLFAAQKGNFQGVIDSSGKEISPFIYTYIKPERTFLIVITENLYGVMNYKHENIIPIIYKRVDWNPYINAFIVTNEKGKMGVMDKNGKEIAATIYDKIACGKHFFEGMKDEEAFYFDEKGNKIEKPK